jgi:lactate racemase
MTVDQPFQEDTMKNEYHVYMGRDRREYFILPEKWVPLRYAQAEKVLPMASAGQMAEEALSRPAGTGPLRNLIAGAKRVVVLVDDFTRPTPVAPILDTLLPYLEGNGVSRETVTIVAALGTHVPMTKEELEARVGGAVVSGYRIVQHNAWQEDLVPVEIPGGGVVRINPEVARADIKIGISSILPHPMAGYGGGPKIVMPGVSNFEYIRDHHMRHTIHPRSEAGRTKGNPFHEAVMEVARTVGLDFSINCVYNQQGELIQIVGGSLEKAFAAAVALCSEHLGARFEEKVDVTITSTYPHTHGHQLFKGLSAPDVITKETGAILLVVPVEVPISTEFVGSFDLVRERSRGNPGEYVTEAMSKGMPFLPDKPVEFNMAMSCAILRPAIRTILVSPMISREEARTMGFEYASSIGEGLAALEKAYPEARVAIFPSGGLIVPITTWER